MVVSGDSSEGLQLRRLLSALYVRCMDAAGFLEAERQQPFASRARQCGWAPQMGSVAGGQGEGWASLAPDSTLPFS